MIIKIWNIFEMIIKKVINFLLSLFHVQLNENQWKILMQFIKFSLVGLTNTLISYVVYIILVYAGLHYRISNIISFIVSVLNSFYWNNKFVFSKKENESRSNLYALIKTFIAYGSTGLVLSSILLEIWIKFFHISQYIAPLISLIITIPLNFIINKFWAYKV